MKVFTSKSIASSSQKTEHLEAKLANGVVSQEVIGAQLQVIVGNQDSIVNKQEDMDAQLKSVVVRQSDVRSDIKAILGILKNAPYALRLSTLLMFLSFLFGFVVLHFEMFCI